MEHFNDYYPVVLLLLQFESISFFSFFVVPRWCLVAVVKVGPMGETRESLLLLLSQLKICYRFSSSRRFACLL